jgi:hypothetical protein
MTIASEFACKIQNLRVRERNLNRFKAILFITEHIAIDYQNGTIDYGSFMSVFYEIKSLYFVKSKDENLRKRLKHLKELFKVYAALIRKSQCRLLFDFYPVEELFYLINYERYAYGREMKFKEIFLGPKEKNLALEKLYTHLGQNVFKKNWRLVIKEAKVMNSALYIKKRFFTKLSSFRKVKENYDYLWNCGHSSEYLSDYYLWIYEGLSKIEYYLNSKKF